MRPRPRGASTTPTWSTSTTSVGRAINEKQTHLVTLDEVGARAGATLLGADLDADHGVVAFMLFDCRLATVEGARVEIKSSGNPSLRYGFAPNPFAVEETPSCG